MTCIVLADPPVFVIIAVHFSVVLSARKQFVWRCTPKQYVPIVVIVGYQGI